DGSGGVVPFRMREMEEDTLVRGDHLIDAHVPDVDVLGLRFLVFVIIATGRACHWRLIGSRQHGHIPLHGGVQIRGRDDIAQIGSALVSLRTTGRSDEIRIGTTEKRIPNGGRRVVRISGYSIVAQIARSFRHRWNTQEIRIATGAGSYTFVIGVPKGPLLPVVKVRKDNRATYRKTKVIDLKAGSFGAAGVVPPGICVKATLLVEFKRLAVEAVGTALRGDGNSAAGEPSIFGGDAVGHNLELGNVFIGRRRDAHVVAKVRASRNAIDVIFDATRAAAIDSRVCLSAGSATTDI